MLDAIWLRELLPSKLQMRCLLRCGHAALAAIQTNSQHSCAQSVSETFALQSLKAALCPRVACCARSDNRNGS